MHVWQGNCLLIKLRRPLARNAQKFDRKGLKLASAWLRAGIPCFSSCSIPRPVPIGANSNTQSRAPASSFSLALFSCVLGNTRCDGRSVCRPIDPRRPRGLSPQQSPKWPPWSHFGREAGKQRKAERTESIQSGRDGKGISDMSKGLLNNESLEFIILNKSRATAPRNQGRCVKNRKDIDDDVFLPSTACWFFGHVF